MGKKNTIVYMDGQPYRGEFFDIDTKEYQRKMEQGMKNKDIIIQYYEGVPSEPGLFRQFLHNWHRKHNPRLFRDESN